MAKDRRRTLERRFCDQTLLRVLIRTRNGLRIGANFQYPPGTGSCFIGWTLQVALTYWQVALTYWYTNIVLDGKPLG